MASTVASVSASMREVGCAYVCPVTGFRRDRLAVEGRDMRPTAMAFSECPLREDMRERRDWWLLSLPPFTLRPTERTEAESEMRESPAMEPLLRVDTDCQWGGDLGLGWDPVPVLVYDPGGLGRPTPGTRPVILSAAGEAWYASSR